MKPEASPPEAAEPATTVLNAARAPSGPARWQLPVVDRERYLLDGVVAQGGNGRILRAQDLHLDRLVALKEPLAAGGSLEARFLAEARITARLQHPSIVPIYEAGRWPTGEPFYAMKLVSGRSLDRLIREARTLHERLALLPHVLGVAEAMAYAHSRRVIHRDLKPANLLVGEFGETVVIDWGLAKELDREEPALPPSTLASSPPQPAGSQQPEHTELGTVMGTPAYMPPEQAAGQPVDERADVYALGTILYHLLAGHPPYNGTTSQEVLSQVLAGPPPPLEQLQPEVRRELRGIVSRAMAREPAQRYASALELAEDLRRFQAGQLVGAHRYSTWELLQRFLQRHRAAVAVAVVALLALGTGAVVHYSRVRAERDRAEQSEREAIARADSLTLLQARNELEQSPEEALRRLDSLSPAFNLWGAVRTLAADAQARGLPLRLRGHGGKEPGEGAINVVLFSPSGQELFSVSEDRSVRRWDARTGTSEVLYTHEVPVWTCAVSPDGRWLASGGKDGQIGLYDLHTRRLRMLTGHTRSAFRLRFSSDSQRLFSAGYEEPPRVWEVASGTGRVLGTGEERTWAIAVLPGDRQLVSMDAGSRALHLWDVESGARRTLTPFAEPLSTLNAAARAQLVAVGSKGGGVALLEVDTGRLRMLEPLPAPASGVALSPEGHYLAAQSSTGVIELWDLRAGTSRRLESGLPWYSILNFSPDGRWLAAGSQDGKARLWEVASGRPRVLLGAQDTVSSVNFDPDSQRLVAGSHDGTARLYPLEEEQGRVVARHERAVLAAALAEDGRHGLSAGSDGRVLRFDLETGKTLEIQAHPGGMVAARALRNGSRLVTAGRDGTLAVWEGTGRLLQRLTGPSQPVRVLALSEDGARVAAGSESGEVWLWEAGSDQGRLLGQRQRAIAALAFSPDGRSLGAGDEGGEVWLWSTAGGQGRPLHEHTREVQSLAFSPNGRYLVSGSKGNSILLHALDSGQSQELAAEDVGTLALLFAPGGQELLSIDEGDKVVRRRSVPEGKPLEVLRGHTDRVLHLALSPEGQRLATASRDGTVRLWDLESHESRALRGHAGPVLHVAFSPHGRQVLSASEDGTVRVWTDDLPLEPQALRAWIHRGAVSNTDTGLKGRHGG